jgi:hypothetical protein
LVFGVLTVLALPGSAAWSTPTASGGPPHAGVLWDIVPTGVHDIAAL